MKRKDREMKHKRQLFIFLKNEKIIPRTLNIFFSATILFLALCAPTSAQSSDSGRTTMREFGARYGFSTPHQSGRNITFQSRYTRMVFETNSRKLFFNDTLIWLNGTLIQGGGDWAIPDEDITKTIDPLLRTDRALTGVGYKTIVLDPGHGGDDSGAIGNRRVYEKKVVLDIANRVRVKLRESGVRVRLTRDTDSNMSLSARTKRAAAWNADLFVSIHVNAAHDTRAHGIETYLMPAAGFSSTAGKHNKRFFPGNRHDRANMVLAYHVHKKMLEHAGGADRGIRRARFDVLRDAPCPAILVECGFVSNTREEEQMLSPTHRDKIASGIAAGIMEYINRARSSTIMSAQVQ